MELLQICTVTLCTVIISPNISNYQRPPTVSLANGYLKTPQT